MQKQINKQLQDKIYHLLELSQTLGVLKKLKDNQFGHFKLAYYPYETSKEFYDHLGNIELAFHKLFHTVSKNFQFILEVFHDIEESDPMIKNLIKIFKKKKSKSDHYAITFVRCDFYNNMMQVPKLTEFNLFSIGMQSNMQQYQKAKKLSDIEEENLYADHTTLDTFAETIIDMYKLRKMKGIYLLVNSEQNQPNFFDQYRLEIKMREAKIICKRVSLKNLMDHISLKQNGDLFYGEQNVSIVYYRWGYKQFHFEQTGDAEKCWRTKQIIQLSNAIPIPNVTMQLINEKRMQARLAKPEILKRFVKEEEAELILSTLVGIWDFSEMTDKQYEAVYEMFEKDQEKYILKPNLEGGGNNYFGTQAFEKLKQLSKEERNLFILMEKIKMPAYENVIFNGKKIQKIKGNYQISRLGSFSSVQGELRINKVDGFLLRAKPQTANEGGIMSGTGFIIPWKFKKY